MSNQSVLKPVINDQAGNKARWGALYGSAGNLALANIAKQQQHPVVLITNDSNSALHSEQELHFYAGDLEVFHFPDWETLPYDSVSPHQDSRS